MSGPMKFWASLAMVSAALIWGLRGAGSGEASGSSGAGGGVAEGAKSEQGGSTKARVQAARSSDRDSSAAGSAGEEEAGTASESEGAALDNAGLETVQQVASEIGGQSPALVIFFSTECPRSRGLFPSLVELSDELSDDTTVMAYSTLEEDATRLPDSLSMYGASFGATPMQKWAPGELTEAMQEVGIRVGPQFALPLVAVVGEGGAVLGQWQGVTDLGAVRQALGSGGMLR